MHYFQVSFNWRVILCEGKLTQSTMTELLWLSFFIFVSSSFHHTISYSSYYQWAVNATILEPRQHVSGYFLIRNFFFPDTASVHTHPANSTANQDIFETDDVAKSCPVSYWTINQYGGTTWGAVSVSVSLEWIRIPSDACGQANSIWIRYL